jgi:hypothetical protein
MKNDNRSPNHPKRAEAPEAQTTPQRAEALEAQTTQLPESPKAQTTQRAEALEAQTTPSGLRPSKPKPPQAG